jgi:hypothetical protein
MRVALTRQTTTVVRIMAIRLVSSSHQSSPACCLAVVGHLVFHMASPTPTICLVAAAIRQVGWQAFRSRIPSPAWLISTFIHVYLEVQDATRALTPQGRRLSPTRTSGRFCHIGALLAMWLWWERPLRTRIAKDIQRQWQAKMSQATSPVPFTLITPPGRFSGFGITQRTPVGVTSLRLR